MLRPLRYNYSKRAMLLGRYACYDLNVSIVFASVIYLYHKNLFSKVSHDDTTLYRRWKFTSKPSSRQSPGIHIYFDHIPVPDSWHFTPACATVRAEAPVTAPSIVNIRRSSCFRGNDTCKLFCTHFRLVLSQVLDSFCSRVGYGSGDLWMDFLQYYLGTALLMVRQPRPSK